MTQEITTIKQQAEDARTLYRMGFITREEAAKAIEPYKQAFNAKSKELAKKYRMKPQLFSLAGYLR